MGANPINASARVSNATIAANRIQRFAVSTLFYPSETLKSPVQ
jgi:hypothetical protein